MKRKKTNNVLEQIKNNRDLLSYARFLVDLKGKNDELYEDTIDEIVKRIVNKKIRPEPCSLGDTIYDDAIYRLSFLILIMTESKKEKMTLLASQKFKEILLSNSFTTGAKYMILNSFANNRRGSSSSSGIHFRLNNAFEKMLKHSEEIILETIRYVFQEARQKYFGENAQEIIYEKEENFFFLLYQGWSGNADDTKELKEIRNAAQRGLKNYPKAIELYWQQLPFEKEWNISSISDFDSIDFPFLKRGKNKHNQLYMKLYDLISISEKASTVYNKLNDKILFWKRMEAEGGYYDSFFSKLNDDKKTLKSVLIDKGFLDA